MQSYDRVNLLTACTYSSVVSCLFKLVLAGVQKDALEPLGLVASSQRLR